MRALYLLLYDDEKAVNLLLRLCHKLSLLCYLVNELVYDAIVRASFALSIVVGGVVVGGGRVCTVDVALFPTKVELRIDGNFVQ